MKKEKIARLIESGILSCLDIHFAKFMARLDGKNMTELFLASGLISRHTRQGHICIDLSWLAERPLIEKEEEKDPVVCPPIDDWLSKLHESPVVGKPGEYKPLILDDCSRLYLYRYWDYQEKLVKFIKKRADIQEKGIDFLKLGNAFNRLFPKGSSEDIDGQQVAAFTAIIKNFCVIAGGPGTGKTTTAAKIMALLFELNPSGRIRTALAAPTGKAAARLQEAIKLAKEKLHCSEDIKNKMPARSSTIHRLLGSIPGSPYFRHNAENPLAVDIVIVDEASMVDLALMSKLVMALSSQTRLILLGDKDQLASVEAGAVLGDICGTGNFHNFSKSFCNGLKTATGYDVDRPMREEDKPGIVDCIVELQKNYRFDENSGIGEISRSINAGDGSRAINAIKSGKYSGIYWGALPGQRALAEFIKAKIIKKFKDYLQADDPVEMFHLFNCFRILCALREGPYGAVAVNMLIEKILKRENLIPADRDWYAGRPLMITGNDYNLKLFNGDVGIVLPDKTAGHALRVFFPGPEGNPKKIHPMRLNQYETVYAMTVHKSQGSEFGRVLLILPDRESPVLTRELIYTAITRAREEVEIWGIEDVFLSGVSKRIERASGLRDALWGHG